MRLLHNPLLLDITDWNGKIMNITQIEIFINVSETLNFSETAQKLHLTQPAVTKVIKQLESELNVQLFERSKKGVSLTDKGKYFYQNMSDILIRIEQTISQMQNDDLTNTYYLGYTNTPFEKRFLPQLLKELKDSGGSVNLHLRNFNLNSGINDLLSRRFDLLLTTPDNIQGNTKIGFEPIFEYGFSVLLPKIHPLSKYTSLKIEQLIDTDILLFNLQQSPPAIKQLQNDLIKMLNKTDLPVAETANIMVTLVKGEQGVGILPSFVVDQSDEELSVIPLDYPLTLTYGVAYLLNSSEKNYELTRMISLIKKTILEHR